MIEYYSNVTQIGRMISKCNVGISRSSGTRYQILVCIKCSLFGFGIFPIDDDFEDGGRQDIKYDADDDAEEDSVGKIDIQLTNFLFTLASPPN